MKALTAVILLLISSAAFAREQLNVTALTPSRG